MIDREIACSKEPVLVVRVSKAASVVWEGKALSVSSKNSKGPFDILPYHTNFITYMENASIHINTGTAVRDFVFNQAVLHVQNDVVHIYTDI